LTGVGEVPVLRLPEHQGIGRMNAVAVLEAHRGGFAQRTVVYRERRLRLRNVLKGRVGGACLRIMQDEVALAECAALGVLAAHANGYAVGENTAECQRLGVSPVNPIRSFDRLSSPPDQPFAARVP